MPSQYNGLLMQALQQHHLQEAGTGESHKSVKITYFFYDAYEISLYMLDTFSLAINKQQWFFSFSF